MNFSNIARQLKEGESVDAAAASSEKAANSALNNKQDNERRRGKQKSQMATQTQLTQKSGISYASEEARQEREYNKMVHNQKSDWRAELNEAIGVDDEGNHPFVDVMPFMDQKQKEAKKQVKTAVKDGDGHHQGSEGELPTQTNEGALNPFQVHFDKDGKSYTSKGTKAQRDRISKNIKSNAKNKPDPYRARAGESD